DLPSGLARVHQGSATPRRAVLAVGVVIAALALTGNVALTWSFSAFTVLVYYACTNLAALRLPAAERRYPRWIAAAGLLACASLALWVDVRAWTAGLLLLAAGLLWHVLRGPRGPGPRAAARGPRTSPPRAGPGT